MTIKLSDHFTYRKLLKFCFSPIMMMIFTSVYGVVDGLFVSNFTGKTPFAAINLIFPFIMLFGGIGFMFGSGGSALVAKTLGEKEPEKADRYFSMMVIVSILTGVVISVFGIAFMRPIAILLGADEAMLPYCVVYGRIIIGFNTAFMLQNLFQSFLITAEKPKLGLWITVISGVTNMILDALFVGVFRWGVVGAAIATGISQCVGGVLPLIYFLRPNDSLLRLRKTVLEFRPILQACANGVSEVVNNVTSAVVGMFYNFQLLKYAGESGIAAYGAIMYEEFVFIAVFIGYSIGSAPIISYHFGAKNHTELKNLLRKSAVLMIGGGLGMFAIAELSGHLLASVFVGYDAELLNITTNGFRIYSAVFLFSGCNIFSSSFFTALNNGGVSAAISFLRTFLFKLSAILFLPLLLGLNGVWWATILAEAAAFAVSLLFLVANRKKYQYL